MAKKNKKQFVKLICSDCARVNYFTRPAKEPEEKLEIKKFCKWCGKHTSHTQKK